MEFCFTDRLTLPGLQSRPVASFFYFFSKLHTKKNEGFVACHQLLLSVLHKTWMTEFYSSHSTTMTSCALHTSDMFIFVEIKKKTQKFYQLVSDVQYNTFVYKASDIGHMLKLTVND